MSKARLAITAVVVEGRTQAEVAATYGVSKGWVSKLITRYNAEDEVAFESRSRHPKSSPGALEPGVVAQILQLREQLSTAGLDAGPDTIAWHLEHHHGLRHRPQPQDDALDAHSIAMVAVRTQGLRVVAPDGELEVLRMLTDRGDELARFRVQTVNRLQRLLSELIPGQRKKDLSALQARAMLATVRPRDIAGKTRRRMAAEEIADLVTVDAKLKKIKAELKAAVIARGSNLLEIHGVGPAGAARILADVGDIARFADRNRFASWTGTAPLDASSGEQIRHRLSRAGNRRMNHVIHIAAIVQLRHNTEGRAYYRRKLDAGKTPMEALRCLKRRLSDVIYRRLVADAQAAAVRAGETGPGGHCGATQESSAADLPPHIDTSDKPLPGPATPTLQRASCPRKTPRTRTPQPTP